MSGDSFEVSSKFCLERDHEIFYATLHCTFYNCDQKSRRVCASCLFWKIHQHGQSNTNHIISEEILIQQTIQFKEIVQQKVSPYIDNLKNEISKQQYELYYFLYDCSIIKDINSYEFIYKQNECLVQIEKLIGIIKQFQIVLQISIQQFKKDVMSLNQHILKEKQQDYQIWEQGFCYQEVNTSYNLPEDDDLNLTSLKPQHQNFHNYQMIQNFQNQNIETQIIIHDKELVRAKQNTLQIFDLENKSMKKKFQIQNKIVFICFNIDNRILFFGDFQGFVYGYRLNQVYNLMFKRKIHNGCIKQIYSIYDEIISICANNVIKITNFRNRKLIFKHKISFNLMVKNLNYDFIQGNIITQGYDNILILNRSNHRMILDSKILELQNNKTDMEYVQPNYLIYLSENILKKIKITYQERKLVCFKEFNRNKFDKLISFSSVDCGNKIILTSVDNIYILNQNLIILQQIPIKSDRYVHQFLNFKVKQINSMDKIIIIKNGLIRFLVNLLGQNHRELQIRQQLMFPRKLIQLSS